MSQSHRIKAFGPEFRFSKNLWKVLVLPRARLIPDLIETFVFKLGKKVITFKFSINSGKIICDRAEIQRLPGEKRILCFLIPKQFLKYF